MILPKWGSVDELYCVTICCVIPRRASKGGRNAEEGAGAECCPGMMTYTKTVGSIAPSYYNEKRLRTVVFVMPHLMRLSEVAVPVVVGRRRGRSPRVRDDGIQVYLAVGRSLGTVRLETRAIAEVVARPNPVYKTKCEIFLSAVAMSV